MSTQSQASKQAKEEDNKRSKSFPEECCSSGIRTDHTLRSDVATVTSANVCDGFISFNLQLKNKIGAQASAPVIPARKSRRSSRSEQCRQRRDSALLAVHSECLSSRLLSANLRRGHCLAPAHILRTGDALIEHLAVPHAHHLSQARGWDHRTLSKQETILAEAKVRSRLIS